MIRLIGMFLILFSGTMLGFYQAHLLASRPRQIRQLIQALKRLETEVHYGSTPLPAALRSVSRGLQLPLVLLLERTAELLEQSVRSTGEAWQLAAEQGWKRTALKAEEYEIWLQLGATAGATDRDEQIKHIRLAATQLQAEEETAQENRKRYETMWKSLGVLGGALIVILMF